jgi:DnaJ-class molecular chaperone
MMDSDEQPRPIRQVCGQCNGAGVVDIRGKGASSTAGDYAKRCPTCEGTGWILGATRA